ncbi:MAG: hypothetical protein QXU97_04190 [Fervidicoccaceae archaeon]
MQQSLGPLARALADLAAALPHIVLAALVLLLSIIIAKYVNKLIDYLVVVSRVEEHLSELLRDSSLRVSPVAKAVADLGILAAGGVAAISILPLEAEAAEAASSFVLRIASVGLVLVFAMVGFSLLTRLLRPGGRIEAMLILTTFFIVFAALLDLTSLSPEVRSALASGLSLGLGLSIGVLSLWLFFGEYIEAKLSERERS